MPGDDSLISSSLKRRFRKVASRTGAQHTGSGDVEEQQEQGEEQTTPGGPQGPLGSAPPQGTGGAEPEPQQINGPESNAPAEESGEGEQGPAGTPDPAKDAPKTAMPRKGSQTAQPAEAERTVNSWGMDAGAGTSDDPGTAQPPFNEVQGSLSEIFAKKAVTNPLVKALLDVHGTVDARELTEELDQFARNIGARKDVS